jgi:hypothetical protein
VSLEPTHSLANTEMKAETCHSPRSGTVSEIFIIRDIKYHQHN